MGSNITKCFLIDTIIILMVLKGDAQESADIRKENN